MDFSSIVGTITKSGAPLLGGLLGSVVGGPVGGAIGSKIGQAVGEALGVEPTPAAINDAIAADPAGAAEKLSAIDAAKYEAIKAEAEALARIVESNNAYHTSAQVSNDPYARRARPTTAYALSFSAAYLTIATPVMVWVGKGSDYAMVINALGLVLGGLAAAATGAAWQRGKEKIAAMTGQAEPTIVGSAIKALTKK